MNNRSDIKPRLIRDFYIGISVAIALLWFCVIAAPAQNLTPEKALSRMTLATGLKAALVAAEPLVRQPVAIDFDDRGRLWVIQYLQYPNPAGLNRVKVDRYSRTKYDRMPEPPPYGPKGADRLTILKDNNGDGRADTATDFITGLNLTTGFAFGDSGVYLLQAPYLLHYADKNQDDIPDGPPRVLLTGFGMDDAHSLANSLTWGPDGWLYGLQGSTVTAKIRGIEFQQGIWRYHPPTDRFELFAEGGGNMWGLDFDRSGQLFASTNFGPHIALHVVQDAYYWKQFGKHGPLHNPFAYGHFDHMPHTNPQGGHVTAGGLFYQAGAWPAQYRGQYIGANVLSHWVAAFDFQPVKSSYKSTQSQILLDSNDPWYAPCDLALGLDGNIYVADWHDQRMAHPDPDADWDRTNGRIYAIQNINEKQPPLSFHRDLSRLTSTELMKLLANDNSTIVRRARRLLKERGDKAANAELKQIWTGADQPLPLRREAFWTLLSQTHDLSETSPVSINDLIKVLLDKDPAMRRTAIAAIGDMNSPTPELIIQNMLQLAQSESDTTVLGQLATTSARVGSIPLWEAVVRRSADITDDRLGMRLWWAAERLSQKQLQPLTASMMALDGLKCVVFQETVLPRFLKKLAYLGGDFAGDSLAAFVEKSGSDMQRRLSILLEAMRGGAPVTSGRMGIETIPALYRENSNNLTHWELAARMGLPQARMDAERLLRQQPRKIPDAQLTTWLKTAADLNWANWGNDALTATQAASQVVKQAGWAALGRLMGELEIAFLIHNYGTMDNNGKMQARDLLTSRPDACGTLLAAVEAREIPQNDFDLTQVARIATLQNSKLTERALRIWGKVQSATPEERLAEVRRLNNDLRAADGDPVKGRVLFQNNCGRCHKLFGEGQMIGPELTGANRADRQWLLTSVVDPSGIVRKEYQSQILQMKDGRVLEGLILEQSGGILKLVDSSGRAVDVLAGEVAERRDSATSLMPDGLYKLFKPQELRDLFSYIQQNPGKH